MIKTLSVFCDPKGILECQRRSRTQITVGIYSMVVFDHLPLSQTIQSNYFQVSSSVEHSIQ